MTDKEILQYSKQIVEAKKNIENSDTTEPDLKNLISSKFLEDSVNRAKFIDSTLIIGSASTEFRNVFGVEVPHYDISNCYLAINRNDIEYRDDDIIEISDPMQNNSNVREFLDSWEMINAAKFDSETTIPNFDGDEKVKPVDKQRFFVDEKKGSTDSSIYQPFCPPGYNSWSGEKVYDYISKNFTLDELTIYKLLNNGLNCTASSSLNMQFNGDNKFRPNIVSDSGKIANGEFVYEFNGADSMSKLLDAQRYGEYGMPYDGCKAKDISPVTYLTINIPVTSNYVNGRYYYKYNRNSTIFSKSRTILVNYSLRITAADDPISLSKLTFEKMKKKLFKKRYKSRDMEKEYEDIEEEPEPDPRDIVVNEFNKGIALLCEDQFQVLPSEGSSAMSSYPLRFTFNVITRENNCWDAGDTTRTTELKTEAYGGFLGIGRKYRTTEVTHTNYHNYTLNISPIRGSQASTEFPNSVKKYLVETLMNNETDFLDYDSFIKQRGIINGIPDSKRSSEKSWNLFKACKSYLSNRSSANYNNVVNKLKDRVVYDIYMEDVDPGSTGKKVSDLFDVEKQFVSQGANMNYVGTEQYISGYNITYVRRWPYWFSWWSKRVSTPIYSSRIILNIDKIKNIKQIDNNVKREFLTGSNSSLKTLISLFNSLTDIEKADLRSRGILINNDSTFLINGTSYQIENNTIYKIFSSDKEIEGLPFNNIKRALKINNFIKTNPDLYKNIFSVVIARLDKRNGTLREVCNLLENTNVSTQMTDQKKRNIAELFDYINSYNISGGFGSKEITINLATWENTTSAYCALERMSTVYLLCDNTKIENGGENFVNNGYYIKTKIVDIIDLVSDIIEGYTLTKDSAIIDGKQYYEFNYNTEEYEPVVTENGKVVRINASGIKTYVDVPMEDLYEKGEVLSGPVFKVTLQDELPINFKNKNPILTKVY